MKEIRCLAATGQLGYGISSSGMENGLSKNPDFIGADMGSVDPGPSFLGSGKSGKSPAAVKSDLKMVIGSGIQANVPVLLGSAGTAGGNPHLNEVLSIVKELAHGNRWRFRLAVIHSEMDKGYLVEMNRKGKIEPLGTDACLTDKEILNSERVVAQIGIEPYIKALEGDADVVLAGRACDTSIYTALPVKENYDCGLATHMAKIIECASLCAKPGGRDPMMGYLREDHFVLESQNPNRKCTCLSVAAHSLYEQADPFVILAPGGRVDLSNTKYSQETQSTVRVEGSKWVPSPKYKVKLEGASFEGYRSISIGGIRDPIAIKEIEDIKNSTISILHDLLEAKYAQSYKIRFLEYGRNGVLGDVEREDQPGHEMCLVVDVVAKTPELASRVCGIAKQHILHYHYPGILATGGNVAYPFPDVIDVGPAYKFNVYHLLELEDPVTPFRIEYMDF